MKRRWRATVRPMPKSNLPRRAPTQLARRSTKEKEKIMKIHLALVASCFIFAAFPSVLDLLTRRRHANLENVPRTMRER
jgi:hypothetical protein